MPDPFRLDIIKPADNAPRVYGVRVKYTCPKGYGSTSLSSKIGGSIHDARLEGLRLKRRIQDKLTTHQG